jgi:hypothetical protein
MNAAADMHPALQVSRRAAVLLTLLPAFAGAAHAKGDTAVPFSTEIAGSEGSSAVLKHIAAFARVVNIELGACARF